MGLPTPAGTAFTSSVSPKALKTLQGKPQVRMCLADVRARPDSSLRHGGPLLLTVGSQRPTQCLQALHLFVPAGQSSMLACIL